MGYDAKRAVQKQIETVEARVGDYRTSVLANKVHPGQAAIKKKGKMKANFQKAMEEGGKFDEGCNSYTLADWANKTAEVGARNLPQGLRDSEDKSLQFHEQLSKHIDNTQASIDGMADETLDQRLNKMKENALRMAKFKRSRRR